MVLPSTLDFDIQSGGSDLNSGAYARGGVGTDRSLSTSPHVTFNGTTVTATTAGISPTITITGYTVLAADEDNTLRIASGTNFTPGLYHIDSVNVGANTWTLDRNVSSGAGSGMVGRMGGCLASPGQAAADHVNENRKYIQGTAIFDLSSSSNVSGGRISDNTVGSNLNPGIWEGYSVTHGDHAAVPTLRCNANSMTALALNGNILYVRSLRFTRNGTTGAIGISSVGQENLIRECVFDDLNGLRAVELGGPGNVLEDCEFDTCVVAVDMTHEATRTIRCTVHDGTDGIQTSGSRGGEILDCLGYNMAGEFINLAAAFSLAKDCTGHNCDSAEAVFFLSAGSGQRCINCLATGNGNATGFGFKAVNDDHWLEGCAAQGNTGGDHTGFNAANITGFVSLSADPYTNAAGADFSPNDTAGGGASIKNIPVLLPGSSTTSYVTIGVAKAQSAVQRALRKHAISRRSF